LPEASTIQMVSVCSIVKDSCTSISRGPRTQYNAFVLSFPPIKYFKYPIVKKSEVNYVGC